MRRVGRGVTLPPPTMDLHTWTNLTPDGGVRAIKYSFGPGTANTLAVRLDDGTFLVVSPGARLPTSALDALAKDGEVSALVAPNAYHHLGQGAWRARFPKATSYAPDGSLSRLAKQATAVPFRPLSELTAKLPAGVRCHVPDGMKVPDLLVSADAAGGAVWFSGDLISNTTRDDVKPLPRLLFKLLGGGEGYRFNKVPAMVYVRDRDAWRATLRGLFEKYPPATVLPAHGDPLTERAAEQTQALLA